MTELSALSKDILRKLKIGRIYPQYYNLQEQEDIDLNWTWVFHGYKCLKKTRLLLLQYWFTKTKSDATYVGNISNVFQTIIVVWWIKVKASALVGSAEKQMVMYISTSFSRHISRHDFSDICTFCLQHWRYKGATLGGEATPVCSDSLCHWWSNTSTWAKGGI